MGQTIIWFQPTCTIDTWVDENYGISSPIARLASFAFTNGSTETISLGAGANGRYDITITGLTEGHHITATGSVNFSVNSISNSGVVPANGTLKIDGILSPNGKAAAASVITINDTDNSQSMTITINQAIPTN